MVQLICTKYYKNSRVEFFYFLQSLLNNNCAVISNVVNKVNPEQYQLFLLVYQSVVLTLNMITCDQVLKIKYFSRQTISRYEQTVESTGSASPCVNYRWACDVFIQLHWPAFGTFLITSNNVHLYPAPLVVAMVLAFVNYSNSSLKGSQIQIFYKI